MRMRLFVGSVMEGDTCNKVFFFSYYHRFVMKFGVTDQERERERERKELGR